MGRRRRSGSISPQRGHIVNDKNKKKRTRNRERSSSSSDSDDHDWKRKSSHSSSTFIDKNSRSDIANKKPKLEATAKSTESLGIEDSNALRAKLGLAPLEVDQGPMKSEKDTNGSNKTVLTDGVVWAPALDVTDARKTEKIREKLAILKEKREIENSRLTNVSTLGEDSSYDKTANEWIQKMRKIQERKAKEEVLDKQIEDASKDFGLDHIIEDAKGTAMKSKYSSNSLRGLKVEHSVGAFLEKEEATILTLKDKKILDDEGDVDVLVNVNLLENERHAKNVENRKRGKDYKAYEDDELDEHGMPNMKMPSLLKKYDDESKSTFKIGDFGEIDDEEARYRNMVKKELESKTVSLAMPQAVIASEYLTATEEAEKFTKRKRKVKKVRTQPPLTAEMLQQNMDDDSKRDRGNRNSKLIKSFDDNEALSEDDWNPDWISKDAVKLEDDVNISNSIRKSEIVAKSATKSDTARLIAEKLKRAAVAVKEEPEEMNKSNLVFDNTAEFCRAVCERNKQEPVVKVEPDELMKSQLDRELEDFAMKGSSDSEGADDQSMDTSGWDAVSRERTASAKDKTKPLISSVLSEEPEITSGVMGALMTARHKGYLEKEGGKRTMGPVTQATCKILPEYAIEDKNAKKIEDKWSRKEDRDKGALRDFRDDTKYRPSFNLQYFDGNGRQLNEKEAFRDLSHKFHGKGSGKLKNFKRTKKLEEERKMKGMSSDDTPLHMVSTMREKQKSLGSAFIVLSGAGQNLASSGTDFKKR